MQIYYSVYVPKLIKIDWEYTNLLQWKPCAVFFDPLGMLKCLFHKQNNSVTISKMHILQIHYVNNSTGVSDCWNVQVTIQNFATEFYTVYFWGFLIILDHLATKFPMSEWTDVCKEQIDTSGWAKKTAHSF